MEAASRAGAGRDRLSELPDCLLHSVLSSLRSRQVVQSCVLSRRWRHLWRSVPCLDVDQRDFLLDEPEPEAPVYHDPSDPAWDVYHKAQDERLGREIKRQRCFEDFADAVLLFHGASPLDACRLHVADLDLRTALYRWMRRGLARHPAELRVAYGDRSHHDDPSFSLDLVSGGGGALSVTSRLRRLHLSGLTLSERFAEELRSECPVLEDLELVECEYDYRFEGRIASSSIKRLHIEGLLGSNSSLRSLLTLALPALVSLNLDKVSLPDIEDELQSLAVASITYPSEYRCEYRFLKSMRNVRVLELRSFTTTGLLEEEPEVFREFHNLRTLILIECEIGERCQVLRYMLENVSNLERLSAARLQGHASWFCRGESASSWCGTAFHGCRNLKSIQVKYEDQDVPCVLVGVLTQIAKDVVKTHRGKRDYVGWLDWMRRVVGWQKKFLTRQRNAAAVAESEDNSYLSSDEEHESNVWKHGGRKKHDSRQGIRDTLDGPRVALIGGTGEPPPTSLAPSLCSPSRCRHQRGLLAKPSRAPGTVAAGISRAAFLHGDGGDLGGAGRCSAPGRRPGSWRPEILSALLRPGAGRGASPRLW